MNKRTKIIALICSGILVLIFILYYYFFVYGFNVSTSMLFDTNVKIKDNIVSVTADTASSGYAFAGYDTVWIVDELQIKPRYSISSNYNRSGKLEIIYDTKDRRLDKIILVGITEDDKKQIWPNNTTVEPNLLIGVYELHETDEPVKPNLVLKDNHQFVFTYSALSSYLPIGTYQINKSNLILETDDGKYQYIFEIKDNTLIFNKEESSSISLGDVKDGSVLTLLSGCVEITDWEPTAYETVNNFDGVSMTVNEETVSATGLTVVYENHSDSECVYGEYFLLEKKINGNWYQVPVVIDDYGFNDLGYKLSSDENGEWNIEWDWLYGSLDAGEYRIVKDIRDFRGKGDSDQYNLAAEFTIF